MDLNRLFGTVIGPELGLGKFEPFAFSSARVETATPLAMNLEACVALTRTSGIPAS
jgi:hypothetical protein